MKNERIIKMKYKEYPRVYEKVYTDEKYLSKFDKSLFGTDYEGGPEEYSKKFKSFFRDFDKEMWLKAIQYYWMQKRFFYKGEQKTKIRSHVKMSTAYSTFIKHHIGHNYQILTSTFFFGKAVYYIDDFYKDKLDKVNPFTDPGFYEFPYKNIGLAHLTLVYQMDERLDLLEKADKENMSYFEFLDFLINYIYCVNDEKGKTVFSLQVPAFANLGSHIYIIYHYRKTVGTKVGLGKGTTSSKGIRRKPYERNNTKI
jgi:hypothetical protein